MHAAARARAGLLAVATLTVTALLGGCDVTYDSGGGATPTNPIDQVDSDTLAGDIRTAVDVTDAFWRAFPEEFGRSYRSPRDPHRLGSPSPRSLGGIVRRARS